MPDPSADAPDLNAETLNGDVASLPSTPAAADLAPHLRIFDPERGASRVSLKQGESVIGRAPDADVLLPNAYVSRRHAALTLQGSQCWIEDAGSNSGTLVNNERIAKQLLCDGDTIQIRDFVLQYREREVPMEGEEPAPGPTAAMERVFREQYNYLPDSMTIRYREIWVPPSQIFAAGDTVVVGEGGILIPARRIRQGEDWILEIEILWPNGQRRKFFGEYMGNLRGTILCVKLHAQAQDGNEEWFQATKRGSWTEAVRKDGDDRRRD